MARYATRPGSRFPPGATPRDGVNFCVFGRHATRVELLLFEAPDAPEPFQVDRARARGEPHLPLLARVRRRPARGHLLHVADGRSAGHRADRPALRSAQGPARPLGARRERRVWDRRRAADPAERRARLAAGHRDGACHRRGSRASSRAGSTVRSSTSSTSAASRAIPRAASSTPEPSPALIEKIPYLRELGVTHVELMPVMAFDAQDVPPRRGARPPQLLGLQHAQLLEPAPALLPRAGAGGARVPRADRRAARRGHRRAARRRLQPHRGGRRLRARSSTSRASPTTSSTCSIRPTGAATATSPAAATPSAAITRW